VHAVGLDPDGCEVACEPEDERVDPLVGSE
jgi:hypothetical protein